jgi:D-sedoheptulose 7-phosphate isomerase
MTDKLKALYDVSSDTAAYSHAYLDHMADVVRAIPGDDLPRLIELTEEAVAADKTIFVMANGGSGAVANHWANDLGPNSVVPGQPGIRIISLCENPGSITAVGNDVSFEDIFKVQLQSFMRPGDLVIAMSVSGNSPNIISGMEYAREAGAVTVGISGMDGGALAEKCDHAIVVLSTRDEYGPVEDAFSVIMHVVVTYVMQHRGRRLAH